MWSAEEKSLLWLDSFPLEPLFKRALLEKAGGAVKLVKVQPSGGKIMNGGDLINGRKAQKGQVFSC